ncbi:hypothetical protein BD408DRAFT_26158 [Parasitella parasitica]|nr:hypothetical protein BD408DRAFT_26158 [Parasitella parasitica]
MAFTLTLRLDIEFADILDNLGRYISVAPGYIQLLYANTPGRRPLLQSIQLPVHNILTLGDILMLCPEYDMEKTCSEMKERASRLNRVQISYESSQLKTRACLLSKYARISYLYQAIELDKKICIFKVDTFNFFLDKKCWMQMKLLACLSRKMKGTCMLK